MADTDGDTAADVTTADNNISNAIAHARETLGYEYLKEAQEEAITSFLLGKDVFVSLPTGYGKSVVYEFAPICTDFLATAETSSATRKPALAVVISPLVSLMEDQKMRLQSRGVKTVYFSGQQDGTGGICDDTAIVLSSPETMLGAHGRKLMRQHGERVCGIFIDESHCISMWGQADKDGKIEAFRHQYGRLAELRSLLCSSIPVVALTATATPRTRDIVVQSLCMSNLKFIIKSPNRTNIRYSFINIPEPDTDELFMWLVTDLRANGKESDRVIVYCGSRRQCRELYAFFEEELNDPALFAMFHRMTPESEKERIVKSMASGDGDVRVLFATVAFGMGVDAKAVHSIIHISLPKSEDCYFQESGRAGRDGLQSEAVLLQHPGWRAGRVKVSDSMKAYGTPSLTMCRRKHLLGVFGFEPTTMTMHLCCDICAKKCLCAGDSCGDPMMGKGKSEQNLNKVRDNVVSKTKKLKEVRTVDDHSKQALSEQLTAFHQALLTDTSEVLPTTSPSATALYTGEDIASAFPMEYIHGIVANASKIANVEQLNNIYPLFNDGHKATVWDIFTRTVIVNSSHDVIPEISSLTLDSSTSDISDSTSESDEDSLNEVVRWTIVGQTSESSSAESRASSSDSDNCD